MAKRRKYTDKYKAGAVVLLESEGYPDDKYAIERVAKRLGVPGRTLRRWVNGGTGAPPDEVVKQQKGELVDLIEVEIREAFAAMYDAREDASYRDLVTGAAILVDKLQLLEGKPTERSEQAVTHDVGNNIKQAILSRLGSIADARPAGTGDRKSDA